MTGPTTNYIPPPLPCMTHALGNPETMSPDAKSLTQQVKEYVGSYYRDGTFYKIMIFEGKEYGSFFKALFGKENVLLSESYPEPEQLLSTIRKINAVIWVESESNWKKMRSEPFHKEWNIVQDTINQRNIPVFSLRIGSFTGNSLSYLPIYPTNQQQGKNPKNPNLVSLVRIIIQVVGKYNSTTYLSKFEERADLLEEQAQKALLQAATLPPVEEDNPNCPETVTELFNFLYQPVVYDTHDYTEITDEGYAKRDRYRDADHYCCLALDPQAENKGASPLELQVSKNRSLPAELIKKYGLPRGEFTLDTDVGREFRVNAVKFINSIPNSQIEEIAFVAMIPDGQDNKKNHFKIIFTCADQLAATKMHILICSLFNLPSEHSSANTTGQTCTRTLFFEDQEQFMDAMRFIVQQHAFEDASRRAFMSLLSDVLYSSKKVLRHQRLVDYLNEFISKIKDNRKVTEGLRD